MKVRKETGKAIAALINDISCSSIMCDAMDKNAAAATKAGRFEEASEWHQRWRYWWNDGVRARRELNAMGIPVNVPGDR